MNNNSWRNRTEISIVINEENNFTFKILEMKTSTLCSSLRYLLLASCPQVDLLLQSTCWLESCLMFFHQLRPNLWPDDRLVGGRPPPSPRPWFVFPPKKLFNTCPALPPLELMLTKKKRTKPRSSPLTPSSRNAARKPMYTIGSITWSPMLKLLSPAAFSLSLSTEKMLTDCPWAAAASWWEPPWFRISPWTNITSNVIN